MSDQLTFSGSYAYGIVESIDDPMKICRVQVRLFGIHSSDKNVLPTEHLPWCQILIPVTSNEASTHGIRVGHCVKCSFLDGIEMQIPIVEGILPGIVAQGSSFLGLTDKTMSKYGDGRDVVKKEKIDASQPEDPYAAKYPYNHVFETATGHRIEVDDTPGAERLHIYHKSGSNTEFHPDGSLVTAVTKDSFFLTKGDSTYFVSGDDSAVIKGNKTETVEGNIEVEVKGNLTVKVDGKIEGQSTGDINLTSASNIQILAGGNLILNAAGQVLIG